MANRSPWSRTRRRACARLAVPVIGVAIATAAAVAASPAPLARALPSDETWTAQLSVDGGDDTAVVASDGAIRLDGGGARALSARAAQPTGELLLPPRRPAAPAARVSAAVTADVPPGSSVEVDVRGTRGDGSWGPWFPSTTDAPAVLEEPAVDVQVKLVLTAGQSGMSPAVRRVVLDAAPAGPAAPAPATTDPATLPTDAPRAGTTTSPSTTAPSTTAPSTTAPTTPAPTTRPSTSAPASTVAAPVGPLFAPPFQARVFASRVGLVGNSTANGHVVTSRDRFVALPSRRVLAPRGTGDYTVQVCTATRCAWAPVYDLGPWNIRDDYWNTQQARENWGVLAQGLPEAQAAYLGKFNGGRDGYGRAAANPAGIDLGDGTYWDDLAMKGNGWVTVSYLWTGRGASGVARPSAGPVVPVRSAPTATAAQVGAVASAARVYVACSATGQTQTGTQGTTDQWLRIAPDMYVTKAQVQAPVVAPC